MLESPAGISHPWSSVWRVLDAMLRRTNSRMSIRQQLGMFFGCAIWTRSTGLYYWHHGIPQGGKSVFDCSCYYHALVFATLLEMSDVVWCQLIETTTTENLYGAQLFRIRRNPNSRYGLWHHVIVLCQCRGWRVASSVFEVSNEVKWWTSRKKSRSRRIRTTQSTPEISIFFVGIKQVPWYLYVYIERSSICSRTYAKCR